ncbi:MAG: hypothetical protein ACRCXD_17710 [Luteolibacter sp.]
MASDRRFHVLQKIVGVLLFIATVVAVWYFEPEKILREVRKIAEKRQIVPVGNKHIAAASPGGSAPDRRTVEPVGSTSKNAVSQGKFVTILHCHLPGNPASEQMADVFNAIQKKYPMHLKVIRAGFPAQPVDWQKQRGISLPYVIMIVDSEKAFQFQGLMPLSKVEKKVEELIFGVRRVGKDWRPVVPGMMPKSH